MMSPERWRKISELFVAAAEQTAEQREAFLSRVCGSDLGLREEVESLLAQDARQTGFLRDTADPALRVSQLMTVESHTDKGLRLGSYSLVRKIAAGGMGAVWLAERADDQFRSRAAVKLIKRGMDTDDILHRFRQERQLLANLRHPNICRLLDGGATADGRPYLVMDYVQGVPIDEYCDAKRLTIRERLAIFRKVCEAVQFAHQNLVVHRDLKPSNILVSQDGTPILLDFGIAKVIQPGDAADATSLTMPQQRLMTPQYASPEQVNGEPITTASDIYSLGVILYVLLTGRHPYRRFHQSLGDLERAIREVDPERPSAAVACDTGSAESGLATAKSALSTGVASCRGVTPEKLVRLLHGDLDTIVMKALHKEPDKRYASAEQFSADIDRHVSGRAVLARPDSRLYRASRFVRRNAALVAAACLLFAVLVLGIAGTTWQARRARQAQAEAFAQRDAATLETEKLRAVTQFLQEMLALATPEAARGRDVSVLKEMLEQAASTVATDFDGQPGIEMVIRDTVGCAYLNLGLYPQAIEQLDAAVRIGRARVGLRSPDTLHAMTGLVSALRRSGRIQESLELAREALSLREQQLGRDHPDVLHQLATLAVIFLDTGKTEEAITLQQEVVDASRRVLGENDVETIRRSAILAVMLEDAGRSDEAEGVHRKLLELQRRAHGNDHPDTLATMEELASTLQHQGKLEEAGQICSQSLEARRRVLGQDHPDTLDSMLQMGMICHDVGRLEEAELWLRETLAIQERVLGENHRATMHTANELAAVLGQQKRLPEAVAIMRRLLAANRRVFGDQHPDTIATMNNLGRVIASQGKYAEAEALFGDALRLAWSTLPADDPYIPAILSHHALCLARLGRIADAESQYLECIRLCSSIFGVTNEKTQRTTRELLAMYEASNQMQKADALRARMNPQAAPPPQGNPTTAE